MCSPIERARARRGLFAGLVALPILTAVGCGFSTQTSAPVDVERARAALKEALDAWKGGKPPGSLQDRPEPIRVADEDWLAGAQLTAYELDPKDRLIGNALNCPVLLSTKGQDGKAARRRVTYLVTTSPSPAVIRQD